MDRHFFARLDQHTIQVPGARLYICLSSVTAVPVPGAECAEHIRDLRQLLYRNICFTHSCFSLYGSSSFIPFSADQLINICYSSGNIELLSRCIFQNHCFLPRLSQTGVHWSFQQTVQTGFQRLTRTFLCNLIFHRKNLLIIICFRRFQNLIAVHGIPLFPVICRLLKDLIQILHRYSQFRQHCPRLIAIFQLECDLFSAI